MWFISIMYHYIENEEKYSSGIFPTSSKRLEHQIQILKDKDYRFIHENQLVEALENGKELKEKTCFLTFDDGLQSQFTEAVPILEKYEVPAVFFVPTRHLTELRGYTIHKVHKLLSLVDTDKLLSCLEKEYFLLLGESMDWSTLDMKFVLSWYRYDTEITAKFKFMINHFLSQEVSDALVDKLFVQFFEGTEKDFCHDLYMSQKQIQLLSRHPLFSVGLHTHSHGNMQVISEEKVSEDIRQNYNVLVENCNVKNVRGISYPFGLVEQQVYDKKIKNTFESLGLSYGFSTKKKVNYDFSEVPFLGRFGANDIAGGKRPIFEI